MRSCVLAVWLCFLGSFANADVVYSLINGAAGGQEGRTLSGSLQFSTVCGTSCAPSDLVGWEFTIQNGAASFPASSSDAGAAVVMTSGFLEVTNTEVILHYETPGEFRPNNGSGTILQFQNDGNGGRAYRGFAGSTGPVTHQWAGGVASAPVVIAQAVPEPSSFLGLSLFVCAAVVWNRLGRNPSNS